MNVAIAFCSFDSDAAMRWLQHACNQQHHSLFLLPVRGLDFSEHFKAASGNWKSVMLLKDGVEKTSDWSTQVGQVTSDASGPNSSFRQVARYFHAKKLGPFFWCEPDCIMLFPDSLDRLEAEYIQAGKPFMGAAEAFPVPHIAGNAIYPENAATYPDLILPHRTKDKTREVAFDLAGARAVLPRAHVTNLIQHVFRAPTFTSRDDFEARVSKEAAVFHSCKDGSIYQFIESGMQPHGMGNTIEALPTIVDVTKAPAQTSNGSTEPNRNSNEAKCARLVKARAELAAKRATGWKPGKRKAKVKKRRARRLHAKA